MKPFLCTLVLFDSNNKTIGLLKPYKNFLVFVLKD